MRSNFKTAVMSGLVTLTIIIGILHFVTPGHMVFYHDTYRRLSYFPITIGAILYGVRGGLGLAVLSCIAFIPHLFTFWARGPQAYYSELSEILFYLAAGLVIGLISSRENRLRESYKRLSEKLSESYARLHDQAAQLLKAEKQLGETQRMSMLGHLSASLAHEIKNPLASIKGAAEILSDEVPPSHPKHEFIEIMRSEISRLNRSVEEVLNYCRGRQTSETVHKLAVDKIVNKVTSLLEPHIHDKTISLELFSKLPEGKYFFNEISLTQAVTNILVNAIDAVELNGRIEIRLEEKADICMIEVTDDGPGIEPSLKESIFDTFVTDKKGGTGLGLSIARKSIESLGGTIGLTASKLGGAGFLIKIPAAQPYSLE
jgi:signal transduction histidine kinase